MPNNDQPAHGRRRIVTTLLAVYWLALLVATHWPKEFLPKEHQLLSNDKLLHLSAYAILGGLMFSTVRSRRPTRGAATATIQCAAVALAAVVSGFLDEVTQPLTSRAFDWYDLLADAAGAVIGVGAALTAWWLSRRSARAPPEKA